MPPWCESILGVSVKAVQVKEFPLEWTQSSGGLLDWWHDPGVPLAFPVESASSWMRRECQEFFPDHAGKGSLISSYKEEKGLLWMCKGRSWFLSSGQGYVGELLELQQGCEGPYGSSKG